MNRPTTEIVFDSKIRLVLYSYLTVGEKHEIKRRTLEHMKIQVDQENKSAAVENFDASFTIDVEDLTLKYLVSEVYDETGTKVADPVAYLRDCDERLVPGLYEKINALTSASTMTEDAKKN